MRRAVHVCARVCTQMPMVPVRALEWAECCGACVTDPALPGGTGRRWMRARVKGCAGEVVEMHALSVASSSLLLLRARR